MKDTLPNDVLAAIAAQLRRAGSAAAKHFDSQQADEDSLTGSLGTELANVVEGTMIAEGFEYTWRTQSIKVRGRGVDAPEKLLGADAVLQIEVVDADGSVVMVKALPVQAKKRWTGTDRRLLDQVNKMQAACGSALVVDYRPEGYLAYSGADVAQAAGNRERLAPDRVRGLGEMLADEFAPCHLGAVGHRYDPSAERMRGPDGRTIDLPTQRLVNTTVTRSRRVTQSPTGSTSQTRRKLNEADTCRTFVVPKLQAAGWENEPHSITEQRSFTDGRIVVVGARARRQKQKRTDYLLRITPDFPIAVVEAKASYRTPGEGMQQAKDYADVLGLRFAYATNGQNILEFDFTTGIEQEIAEFPSPKELWSRLCATSKLTDPEAERLLTAGHRALGKPPRYYQEIAINRVVQTVVQGQRRVLLTMATGTGKTLVAFQICWKLWSSRWNRSGEHRKPRILYLADRNILVDDPYAKMFAPFGDARAKIEGGEAVKSREMYFAIYQALAADERRPGLYKQYPRDFFDFIVVDECHRGSARDDSSWREILEYFEPAHQLGMTATPLREDNRDTYLYFGNPVYQYSLKQGIEDGFLAPYRVHRIVTTFDAAGWRPSIGAVDRLGRSIPDREYTTKDFERIVSLRARTEMIASHLTAFLKAGDRFAKTIVFCVDQEHADDMRRVLSNLNADLVQQFPDYVCRVTADEGDIGRGHLSRFQELETRTPTILTTSQLLTTGVDAPTVKNVVLVRVVGSMSDFKQIIGRGTRVRDDYGKLFFNILDYTGTATTMFADPEFDGDPVNVTQEEMDEQGNQTSLLTTEPEETPDETTPSSRSGIEDEPESEPRKFYVDGGQVEIAAQLVYELDPDGKQLRVVQFADYTRERVRTMFPTAAELREAWAQPERRAEIIERLADRGIDFDELTKVTSQHDADPFDLLCHVAYAAPLRTRRERADRLRKERRQFLERYSGIARGILEELLEKYAEHGTAQFVLPDVLQVPPISDHGNVVEIAAHFGGTEKLRAAVEELQTLLYAA